MKKIRFPLYSIVALAVVFALSLIGFMAVQINDKGIYLYTGLPDFTIEDIWLLVAVIGLALFASAIIVFLFANLKRKWLRVVLSIVLVFLSLMQLSWAMVLISGFMPKAYVELVSDDGQHQIVIAEDCYLFSIYGGDVYEKTSPFTMKKLTKYEADIDFYTPFSDGKYSVTWNKENFELFYDSNGDGELDRKMIVAYLP